MSAGLGLERRKESIEISQAEARTPPAFANKWLVGVRLSANGGCGVFARSAIHNLVKATISFVLEESATVLGIFWTGKIKPCH